MPFRRLLKEEVIGTFMHPYGVHQPADERRLLGSRVLDVGSEPPAHRQGRDERRVAASFPGGEVTKDGREAHPRHRPPSPQHLVGRSPHAVAEELEVTRGHQLRVRELVAVHGQVDCEQPRTRRRCMDRMCIIQGLGRLARRCLCSIVKSERVRVRVYV